MGCRGERRSDSSFPVRKRGYVEIVAHNLADIFRVGPRLPQLVPAKCMVVTSVRCIGVVNGTFASLPTACP